MQDLREGKDRCGHSSDRDTCYARDRTSLIPRSLNHSSRGILAQVTRQRPLLCIFDKAHKDQRGSWAPSLVSLEHSYLWCTYIRCVWTATNQCICHCQWLFGKVLSENRQATRSVTLVCGRGYVWKHFQWHRLRTGITIFSRPANRSVATWIGSKQGRTLRSY